MQYTYNGEDYDITFERLSDGRYRATINAQEFIFDARQLVDGGWLIDLDGRQITAHTASQDESRFVHIEGQTYALTKPDPRTLRRRGAAANTGTLTAQMPGQVTAVQVTAGDAVTAGQTLMILEAMKMEIRVSAPFDGEVAAVKVVQGDVVERGQTLIEMA